MSFADIELSDLKVLIYAGTHAASAVDAASESQLKYPAVSAMVVEWRDNLDQAVIYLNGFVPETSVVEAFRGVRDFDGMIGFMNVLSALEFTHKYP